MLSKLTKVLLVSTSFSPVFLTLWFAEFSKAWELKEGWFYLAIAILLSILCFSIMKIARKNLESMPVRITAISTSDKETVGFIIVYLLPLINQTSIQINFYLLLFILLIFFISLFTTNSYHFNPVLGIFGYHFYEVTIEGGITYVLVTKKNLTNTKKVDNVVQISEYMILEVGEKR